VPYRSRPESLGFLYDYSPVCVQLRLRGQLLRSSLVFHRLLEGPRSCQRYMVCNLDAKLDGRKSDTNTTIVSELRAGSVLLLNCTSPTTLDLSPTLAAAEGLLRTDTGLLRQTLRHPKRKRLFLLLSEPPRATPWPRSQPPTQHSRAMKRHQKILVQSLVAWWDVWHSFAHPASSSFCF
jgi:hypothetical protein